MPSSLGLYLSIPFCRAKCTFCNFASDAFAPGRLPAYLDGLNAEIAQAPNRLRLLDAAPSRTVDSIYFGGGTPSLLSAAQIDRLFTTLREHFTLSPEAEITIECAPGQLAQESLAAFQRNGVNRISFGVQSFVGRETAAVGRLHTAAQCLDEIDRVRRAGIARVGLDLIAGLPHQTSASWLSSLQQAVASGVDHISVYLFEVDEDSRLGAEVLAEGARFSAAAVPSDDDMAAFYELACAHLEHAGFAQYEISNFARAGQHSRHNAKYWQRDPYLGFGLDAHSMLYTAQGQTLRFANTDSLDPYVARYTAKNRIFMPDGRQTASAFSLLTPLSEMPAPERLSPSAVLEETLFLGLRTNAGLSMSAMQRQFSPTLLRGLTPAFEDVEREGLLCRRGDTIALTPRGRLLSNEVFSRLLLPQTAAQPDLSPGA